jgi:hypothetical protein
MLNSAKVRVILPRLVEIKIPGEEFCHYLRWDYQDRIKLHHIDK